MPGGCEKTAKEVKPSDLGLVLKNFENRFLISCHVLVEGKVDWGSLPCMVCSMYVAIVMPIGCESVPMRSLMS